MCGIVAMIAGRDVVPLLTDALKRMEYRGYDSAGVAVRDAQHDFVRRRSTGKMSALNNVIADAPIQGGMGIGHIRWATHGEPSEENAHPHSSEDVMVIHNGIIENWQILKRELEHKNYSFSSQTDTEVIAYMLQSYLDSGLSPLEAFRETIQRLTGAYAIAVMMKQSPETLYIARSGSPLLVGEGNGEMYAGSDALALATVTDRVRYLEEGDYATLTTDTICIYDKTDRPVQRDLVETGLTAEDSEKGAFAHFMLKEIHEQPTVIRQIIAQYIDTDSKTVKPLPLTFDPNAIERLAFVACGTAYHAGAVGRYWIESLAKLNVDIEVASEYRYRDLVPPQNGVFIAISQSGETADTLAALRRAKADKQHIVSVLNVESASMARESHDLLLIHAGTEIGVASTKAFVAQATVILCLAVWLGRQRGQLTLAEEQSLVQALIELPLQIEQCLTQAAAIQQLSYAIAPARDVIFLGRGRHYPIAAEAALKLKEISYIHAEGYAAGEMKHGAIALIDEHVPVICLCPTDEVLEKSLSNMQEVAARKAQIILLAEQDTCEANAAMHRVIMPQVHPQISPILYIVPLQLLSYYTALTLGHDIDQPRNLAKSVTVE